MLRNKKILIIIFSVICLSAIAIYLFLNPPTIEIPDNPNLKIVIDYFSTPTSIITYYFYDDTIIRTSYSGGILSTGPVTSTTTTKYYFNEKINLSELEEFIDSIPRDNSEARLVEITEKNGIPYYIDDLSVQNINTDGLTLAHADLLTEIWKITDKAILKRQSR